MIAPDLSWEPILMYTGKKTTSTNWISSGFNAIRTSMASVGTNTFTTATSSSTGANARTSLGSGQGMYDGFFSKTNITKIAFIDGSGTVAPETNTNYLIYDLVESTGNESLYDILLRLHLYQTTAPNFQANDTVWGSASVLNHTAGTNGYSGLLSSSGGTGFKTTTAGMAGGVTQIPDKFCVLGINRESDNDIQALCAFWGNLNTGKGDSWRNDNPYQTFWSLWGNDFHANSKTQSIGGSLQTAPGVATGASWTGDVYIVAFGT